MDNTRKMVLMPAESVETQTTQVPAAQVPNKNKNNNFDRFKRLLKIVLKIALHNAYNEDFSINDGNGRPISDTDVSILINNALTHEKILVGEPDFIRLLFESKVDPNWIINENVKAKLLNYRKKRPFIATPPASPTISSPPGSPPPSSPPPPAAPPASPQLSPPASPTPSRPASSPMSPEMPVLEPMEPIREAPKRLFTYGRFNKRPKHLPPLVMPMKRSAPDTRSQSDFKKAQSDPWEVPLPSDDDDDL